MILHITSKQEWLEAQARGEYVAPSLASEGFLHFSTDQQVLKVANAFYHGRTDLVVLVVDETRLKPEVRWEAPAGPPVETISEADLFPHVYGPLNLDAVESVLEFPPAADGGWRSLPL
ncbi:MAG TPA: DUF952 domain-containing protein [Anaerolineales bacterium]|nr:DUF952 domain-containing protein [Anaerolineales bacterium]